MLPDYESRMEGSSGSETEMWTERVARLYKSLNIAVKQNPFPLAVGKETQKRK